MGGADGGQNPLGSIQYETYAGGTWDNNGTDWHFAIEGGDPPAGFVMDGVLDPVATAGGLSLHAAVAGDVIYLATDDAGESGDGGELLYTLQLPGTINNDGNLDAGEYLLFTLPQQFASADFNNDGVVNDADLVIWQASLGQNAGGDADQDGDTDGADFLAWQRQRQLSGEPLASMAATVPEPGTVVLLACALAALASKRICN